MEDNTKFKRVEKVFNDLGKFIETLTALFALISAFSMGKEIAGAVKAGRESRDATGSKHPFLEGVLGQIFNTLTEFGILTIGSDAISGSLQNVFDGLLTAAQDIGAAIESIMVYVEPGIKRMAQLNKDMDDALAAFQKFGEVLSAFKTLLIGDGIFGWGGNGEFNDAWMQQVHDFQERLGVSEADNIKDPGALLPKNSEDQLVASIESRIDWLYHIIQVLYELGHALEALEKVENATKSMGDMKALIESDMFRDLIQVFFDRMKNWTKKIYTNTKPQDIEKTGMAIRMLSDTLYIFTGSVSSLSSEQITVLHDALNTINQLANMLHDGVGADKSKFEEWFGGDNSIGNFGRAILTFGGNMEAFFGHISKINSDASKADLLRKNTELVLMSVRTLANATRSIGSGKVESLNMIFNNLGNVGTEIMTFLNDISGFETVENFDVNYIKDILSTVRLVTEMLNPDNFGTMSDHYNADTQAYDLDLKRIEIIRTMFLGKNGEGGIIGLLFDLHKELGDLQKTVNAGEDFYDSFESSNNAFSSFATVMLSMGSILGSLKDMKQFTYDNPFSAIIEAMEIFNFNFDTVTNFINNISELDQTGIDKAVSLFGSLRDLAFTISEFASESFDTGLDNLRMFDWSSLIQSLRDNLTDKFTDGEDVFSPKITPVLELNDQFITDVNKMREMFGVDSIIHLDDGGFFIPDYTSQLATQLQMPGEVSDKLDTISETLSASKDIMDRFNKSLSNMRFSITGEELTTTIWPNINERIGYEMATWQRD